MCMHDADFGRIVEWDTVEDAEEAMRLGGDVHPIQGMHTLLIQSILYLILARCIARILPEKYDDVVASARPCIANPQAFVNDFSSLDVAPSISLKDLGYDSLDCIIRDSQYRVPMLTDMGRLCALTCACKNSAEYYIWMLREDPSYNADTVLELMEHRPELLKGLRCDCPHRSGDYDLL